MPIDDSWTLVEEFHEAAINTKKAGIDGMERKCSRPM